MTIATRVRPQMICMYGRMHVSARVSIRVSIHVSVRVGVRVSVRVSVHVSPWICKSQVKFIDCSNVLTLPV